MLFVCSAYIDAADLPLQVHALVERAFYHRHERDIIQTFEKDIPALRTAEERCQAWQIVAQYEEHQRLYAAAAAHYQKAAHLCSAHADRLSLDAVRAFLCGGEVRRARMLLTDTVAYQSKDESNQDYVMSAVYETWLLLAEDKADQALPLIKAYSKKKKFLAYRAALLFTLWWADNDETARERLINECYDSLEAAAVRGTVIIQPSAFWYLMPKTAKPVAESAVLNPQHAQRAKPLYYQLGFYKTKRYADVLMEDLRAKQFIPCIKEETRASGTVYYVVFVEEDETNTIGDKLKSAGYETVPVFP